MARKRTPCFHGRVEKFLLKTVISYNDTAKIKTLLVHARFKSTRKGGDIFKNFFRDKEKRQGDNKPMMERNPFWHSFLHFIIFDTSSILIICTQTWTSDSSWCSAINAGAPLIIFGSCFMLAEMKYKIATSVSQHTWKKNVITLVQELQEKKLQRRVMLKKITAA